MEKKNSELHQNLRERKLNKTDDKFFQYYEQKSADEDTLSRFENIKSSVEKFIRANNTLKYRNVADIGCGAGIQSILWARSGYQVHGIDINQNLIDLANERTKKAELNIDFKCGSATDLPWGASSIDICLVPELLEHVPFWRECLDEFARVLKPGGILFLSTNNKLCPKQQEFELPLYSWYPGWLKRYYEKLSVTTRPELVSHAQFPAVNWFTFFGLKKELRKLGFESYDRFDVASLEAGSGLKMFILTLIRKVFIFRWVAHVFTPYTMILAIKKES